MSSSKSGFFSDTYTLVLLGVLTALAIIFSFTPIGYLKIGIISISFLPVIVAVAAVCTGKWGGLVLGTVFGLTSFFQFLVGDLLATALLGINFFGYFVMCVVARAAMGFLTGLFADLFRTKEAQPGGKTHAGYVICSLAAPLLNTAFFLSFMALFFGNIPVTVGEAEIDIMKVVVIPALSVNFVIEAIASCIIGTAICEALYPLRRRVNSRN